jgi:hypothetical protein
MKTEIDHDVRRREERIELQRQYQHAHDSATAFAAARGWRWVYGTGFNAYTPRWTRPRRSAAFSLDVFAARRVHSRHGWNVYYDNRLRAEARLLDHLDYFRETAHPYRPVSIVTHSYALEADFDRFAASYGLIAERLPESWYYPELAVAVLFTHDPDAQRVMRGGLLATHGWFASRLSDEDRANGYELEKVATA